MMFFLKKLQQLPLIQLKQRCVTTLNQVSQRLSNRNEDKRTATIRLCSSLLKICEDITDISLITQGLAILQFLKTFTIQVHLAQRIDIFPVKIRATLLGIKWARMQHLSLTKIISRATLFLEQIRNTPFYQVISSDFYSHIQRLYLDVIRENIRVGELGEALRLATVCFEAFKGQIAGLITAFDLQDKKLHRVVERKLQLLEVLFRYEHGVRLIMGTANASQITAQILPKYERITAKIPIIHFPSQTLLMECQAIWSSTPLKSQHQSQSKHNRSFSVAENESNYHFPNKNQRQRSSLQQTVQYLNDFFRKRSASVTNDQQLILDRSPIILPGSKGTKKSYFQKEKQEGIKNIESENKILPILNKAKQQKRERVKSSKLFIEPKKFKLVLEMDRQNREKLILSDPFAGAKQSDLNILEKHRSSTSKLMVC